MIQGILTNLRAIELDDAACVNHWFNTPAVMDGWGLDVAVESRTITAERIARWIDKERKVGRPVAFVIERAADGAAIGLLLAIPDDQESRCVSLSLLIGEQDEWGSGFGSDALDAFLDAAFTGWNLHRIHLEVEQGNVRAERLYHAAGFERQATMRSHRYRNGERADLSMLGLTAESWRSRHDPAPAANRAQDPDERFDIVLGNGEPLGFSKPRWQVHRDGDWHRAIHVWFCGIEDGVPFLDAQRRSLAKDTLPGRLDATVGGHLSAGEDASASFREVEEELGVTVDPAELKHVGIRRAVNEEGTTIRDREIQDIHLVRRDHALTTYRPNPDELAGVVRLDIDALIALLTGEPGTISTRFLNAADGSVASIELASSDFTGTIDRYFLRVAIAARRFLAGETLILV